MKVPSPDDAILDDWVDIVPHEPPPTTDAAPDASQEPWGFTVYRCTYSDDALFKRFMGTLQLSARENLLVMTKGDRTRDMMNLSIVQDREKLEGASKQRVRELRQLFSCESRKSTPRDDYFLYVDEYCLATLRRRETWSRESMDDVPPPVIVILVDKNFNVAKSAAGSRPEMDGCTSRYVGWMYVDVGSIPWLYAELSQGSLEDEALYERPPALYPRKNILRRKHETDLRLGWPMRMLEAVSRIGSV